MIVSQSISLLAFDQRYNLLKDSRHLDVIDDLDHTAMCVSCASQVTIMTGLVSTGLTALDAVHSASTMRSRLPSWLYFTISCVQSQCTAVTLACAYTRSTPLTRSIPLPAVQHLFSAPHRLWTHGTEVYDAYEAKVIEGKAADRMSAVRNLYEATDPTSGRRMKRSTAAGEMTSHSGSASWMFSSIAPRC